MKNLLITSRIERINKKYKPIFIGNWIFDSYEQKINNKLEFNKKLIDKRKKIIHRLLKLENKILNKVIPLLNKYHNKKYCVRKWNIIIGQWLRVYIKVLTNRYSTISEIFKKKKVDKFIIKNYIPNFFFNTFEQFYHNCFNNDFDDLLYKKIIEYKKTNIKIKYNNKIDYQLKFKKKNFKNYFFSLLNFIRIKNEKYFFLQLYINFWENILFHLKFFIFPKFWDYQQFNDYSTPNIFLRDKLKSNFFFKKNSIENFLMENFFNFLPTAYLEDFSKIEKFNRNNYIQNPKYIVTANSFFFNENFKIYVASKIDNCKYIVLQHGNNYNSHFNEQFKSIEEKTSDHFITWGFKKKNKKYITGLMQKKLKKSKTNINNLLLMHLAFDGRNAIWDNYEDYIFYILNLKKLILKINEINYINKVIFRITPDHKKIQNLFHLKDLSSKIFFSYKTNSLKQDIENSNLCVFTYNSSGFYENLSNNIPSIMFINKNYLNEVDTKTRNEFLILYKNNIIHFEVENLKLFLEKNWKNIDDWWFSVKIQKIIDNFTKNNCLRSEDHINEFVKIIKSL
jgi:putative transferase (TIGR04331 family)